MKEAGYEKTQKAFLEEMASHEPQREIGVKVSLSLFYP